MNDLILAIDQGTSSTKTILFDKKGKIEAKVSVPLNSLYPEPGFVEQDPFDILKSVTDSISRCIATYEKSHNNQYPSIATCGISNQRETFLLWNKDGKPLYNAIVWQCKRSIEICNEIQNTPLKKLISNKTGLMTDPYFSGSKIIWLYRNNKDIRDTIINGDAYFGTIDTWLLYMLSNKEIYATDHTNASRTLFFNIHSLSWDTELLKEFKLSGLNLPEVHTSSHIYGQTDFEGILKNPVKIGAMIGDSHAAAFGEGLFEPGSAKVTMGTGSSILMNAGDKVISQSDTLVSTICWSIPDRIDFALEGIIISCGSTLTWIKDQLGLYNDPMKLQKIAESLEGNDDVFIIPAFSGLGTPYWRMDQKASIHGLTFATTREHIIRAGLETIPYQIFDVISSMEQESYLKCSELKADGGITVNEFIMQGIADLLGTQVSTLAISDVSALGAAFLAGLTVGIYKDLNEIKKNIEIQRKYIPKEKEIIRKKDYIKWKKLVEINN